TVTYDPVTFTATLQPSSALAFSTIYTATVDTTVKDTTGAPLAAATTWTFTTAASAAAPTVTATFPAAGGTGAPATKPKATVSPDIAGSTLPASAFPLTPQGGTAVTATVAYDAATRTATLTPSAALTVGVTYTAAIATTVKSADGTALAAPFTWSFTVGTASLVTVVGRSPGAGATNVAAAMKPTITFSAAMDPASLAAGFTLTKGTT